MNHLVIYFSLTEFLKALKPEAEVMMAAFTKQSEENGRVGQLVLTSNGGIDGGTIRTVQITIRQPKSDEPTEPKADLKKAFDTVEAVLKSKGMRPSEGVLLTTGFNESLDTWGTVPEMSLDQLTRFLKDAKGTPAVAE